MLTSKPFVKNCRGVSAQWVNYGTSPARSTQYPVKTWPMVPRKFRKGPEASAGNCLCLLAKTFLIYLLDRQTSGGPQSRILGALSKSNYLLIVIADEIVFTAPIG